MAAGLDTVRDIRPALDEPYAVPNDDQREKLDGLIADHRRQEANARDGADATPPLPVQLLPQHLVYDAGVGLSAESAIPCSRPSKGRSFALTSPSTLVDTLQTNSAFRADQSTLLR